MLSIHFFVAVVIITIGATFIQWFFTGFLFHKYQALTPLTWRKESGRSYAASTLLTLCFAFMFMTIFSLWKFKYGAINTITGIEFSAICWLAFFIPAEIGSAIYVKYAPMFVVGKCISALVEYILAGVIAAKMV